MAKLTDDELKAKTTEFKERLAKGETLDDLLPEAFAVCREADWRVLGMKPYPVQIIGGIVLHRACIAEMQTGEGKTLVATMPTYLNALTGEGVHVVTVNDYLARRDSEWMGKVYRFLGLTVGLVVHGVEAGDRKKAYEADVTYGTNNEFGFDYLRDNMVVYKANMVQRGHAFAIVDEVDSILIDEARTPLIISGKGEGVVVAVGKNTLYGSFAKDDPEEKQAFQKGANSIAWVMLRFMGVLIPLVFLLLGLTGGNWLESFAFALSVAVGLMPEMLPMVITACLARGSLTMSRKQTIIKDINAMQGFGSMDVLCMDKTGTLTNESILLEYYMDVLGNESAEALDLAFLNSFYHSGVRNPIDNALLACQTMPGREVHFVELLAQYRKTDEIPFDYARKVVSTLVTAADGTGKLILKGDVAHVVARCSTVAYRGKVLPMEDSTAQSVSAVVSEMQQDGMKVIAVAQKEMGAADHITSDDEQKLTLVGYLAFFDAPKQTAKASIAALKRLKVTPKVLTGDQADVAVSICRRVGIPCGRVLTGAQLDEMADSALSAAVEEVHVFAELTPGQKVRLVAALEQNGHTVGFLGDGINDIPALCEANVGISVDTAVDAAKDAADVVLLQKDLGVLEEGILEGRKTFTNMLKYIKITASSNFGNILSIVCASAFLPFLPMTSLQLLLLNLLYDALCIILPWDNVDEEETLSPRDWSGRTLGRFMLSFGPISSVFDIATFLFLYYVLCPALCGGVTYLHLTDPAMQLHYVALFQTGWFLESMWTQVLILHFLRTRRIPFVQSRPSAPVMVTTLAGIVVFTGLTFTKGGGLFGLTRLPLWYFGFLLIVALAYMLLTTVIKTFYQKKHHQLI